MSDSSPEITWQTVNWNDKEVPEGVHLYYAKRNQYTVRVVAYTFNEETRELHVGYCKHSAPEIIFLRDFIAWDLSVDGEEIKSHVQHLTKEDFKRSRNVALGRLRVAPIVSMLDEDANPQKTAVKIMNRACETGERIKETPEAKAARKGAKKTKGAKRS